jgi:hypothetical protein
MSEESRSGDDALPDTGGLAMDLAMEEARNDPSLRGHVAAFLADQRALIADQRHHLHLQLRPALAEKWLGVFLRAATAAVGIAFATAVTVMVWDAAHANGLLIEPFTVPPDLAARGLTGQVVASQLLDKLTAMQNATQSYRAPQSYTNNWGDDLKVEIPETGVSIGELRRFLREWLGHDTHISGEVWRTDSGIAISARPGGDGGATFAGPESELDGLVQKAAEHVYAQTQPFRYGNYLRPPGRFREAHASYLRLTKSESARERAWAWYGIAVLSGVWQGKTIEGLWAYRKAVAANPDLTIAWSGIGSAENQRGHTEAGLAAYRRLEELISRGGMADIAPGSVEYVRLQWTQNIPNYFGDYREALRRTRLGAAMPDQQGLQLVFRHNIVRALARQHDTRAARAILRDQLLPEGTSTRNVAGATTSLIVEAAQEIGAVWCRPKQRPNALFSLQTAWMYRCFWVRDCDHGRLWPSQSWEMSRGQRR